MTDLTLSTIAAAAALFVAGAGVVTSAPEPVPTIISINGLGGLELTPVTQSIVASVPDQRY